MLLEEEIGASPGLKNARGITQVMGWRGWLLTLHGTAARRPALDSLFRRQIGLEVRRVGLNEQRFFVQG